MSDHLAKMRAEIGAITAETLQYMRVLHAEKMAKIDELDAALRAERQRNRVRARRRQPPKRTQIRQQR